MYSFGKKSLAKKAQLHPDLAHVLDLAIQVIDFSIIEAWRSKEDQNKYYDQGRSKLRWPKSKHNTKSNKPGKVLAVDILPYPGGWDTSEENMKKFYFLMGIIKGIAGIEGIKVRFGLDWNSNNVFSDQSFHDLPHIELVGYKRT